MPDIFNVFDADNFTREFIKKQVLETNSEIDVSENSAFDDLFITPILPVIRKLIESLSNIDYKSNLKYASLLSEAELDEIGEKNYFIPRNTGSMSKGTETFIFKNIADQNTVVIPAGVILTDDSETYRFFTTTKIILTHEDMLSYYDEHNLDYRVPVPISAAAAGSAYNLGAGKITKCLTSFSSILAGVTNLSALTGGEDKESNEDYAYRISNYYASQHLGMRKGYLKDVLSVPGISSAIIAGKGDELMTRDKIYTLEKDALKSTEEFKDGYDSNNEEFLIDERFIRYDQKAGAYRISTEYLKHIGYGGKVDIYVKGTNYEAQETTVNMPSPLYTLGVKVSNIEGYNNKKSSINEQYFFLEIGDTGNIMAYYTPQDFYSASNPPEYIALFDNSKKTRTLKKYANENFEDIQAGDPDVNIFGLSDKYVTINPASTNNEVVVGIKPFGEYVAADETDTGRLLVVPENFGIINGQDIIDAQEEGIVCKDLEIGYALQALSGDSNNFYILSANDNPDAVYALGSNVETVHRDDTTNANGVAIGSVGMYANKKNGPFTVDDFSSIKDETYKYLIVDKNIVQSEDIIIVDASDEYYYNFPADEILCVEHLPNNCVINCRKDNADYFYVADEKYIENNNFAPGSYVTYTTFDTESIQITSQLKLNTQTVKDAINENVAKISILGNRGSLSLEFKVSDNIEIKLTDGETVDELILGNKEVIENDETKTIIPIELIPLSVLDSTFYIQHDITKVEDGLNCKLYYSIDGVEFKKVGNYEIRTIKTVQGVIYSVERQIPDGSISMQIYKASFLCSDDESIYRSFNLLDDSTVTLKEINKLSLFTDSFYTGEENSKLIDDVTKEENKDGEDSLSCQTLNFGTNYKSGISVTNEDNPAVKFALRQNWDTRYNYFVGEWNDQGLSIRNEGHRHAVASMPVNIKVNSSKKGTVTLKYKIKSHIGPELYCADGDHMQLNMILKSVRSNRSPVENDGDLDYTNCLYTAVSRPVNDIQRKDGSVISANAYGKCEEVNTETISKNIIFNQAMTITRYTSGKNRSAAEYLGLPNLSSMTYADMIKYTEDHDIYIGDCKTNKDIRIRIGIHEVSLKADMLYNLTYNSLRDVIFYMCPYDWKSGDIPYGISEIKKLIYTLIGGRYITPLCWRIDTDINRYVARLGDDRLLEDVKACGDVRESKRQLLLEYFHKVIIDKYATSYIAASTTTNSSFETCVSASNQENEKAIDFVYRNDWTWFKTIIDFDNKTYQIYTSTTGNSDDFFALGDECKIKNSSSKIEELLIDFSWYFDNTDNNSRMRYSEENYFMIDDISLTYEESEEIEISDQYKTYSGTNLFKDSVETFSQGYTVITTKNGEDALLLIRDEEYHTNYNFHYTFTKNNQSSESVISITGMRKLDSLSTKDGSSLYLDVNIPSPASDLFSLKYTDLTGEEIILSDSVGEMTNYELKHYDMQGEEINQDSIYYQSSQENTVARLYLNNPFKLEILDGKFYTDFPYINGATVKLGHSTNLGVSNLGKKYNTDGDRIITTDVLVKESERTYINLWIEVSTLQSSTLSETDRNEMISAIRSYISSLPVNGEIQMSDLVSYLSENNSAKLVDYIKLPFRSFYTTPNNDDALKDQNYAGVENVLRAGKNRYFELGQCKIIQI